MEQAVKTAKARLSSVANAIRLLTSFSGEEDELGITTLAGRLRLAKSTVHRLAATLTGAGFLEQNGETGKYRLGVALFAAMLGIVFTLGMVLTDTLNSWWVAKLVSGVDRRAAFVSRCVSVAIAFLCLALAAGGIAKYVLPALEEQALAFAPMLSVGSILLILAAYALASRFAVLR